MKLQDLVNLITVRNHLSNVINGMGGGINKENQKLVTKKISELDAVIIDNSVSFDVNSLKEGFVKFGGPTKEDLEIWKNTWEKSQKDKNSEMYINTKCIINEDSQQLNLDFKEEKPVKKKGFKRSDENS